MLDMIDATLTDFIKSLLILLAARNAPLQTSPAPVVSTTFSVGTLSAGIMLVSKPIPLMMAPSFPIVTISLFALIRSKAIDKYLV